MSAHMAAIAARNPPLPPAAGAYIVYYSVCVGTRARTRARVCACVSERACAGACVCACVRV